MSAFDLTGAVVFGLISLGGWWEAITKPAKWEGGEIAVLLAFTAGAIFCVARLGGAHL